MSAFLMLFVLGLWEEWLASRDGEFPRHEEIAFWQPSRSTMRRWDVIGVLAFVVFLLTNYVALVAIRDLLGW
jgi:hypothetical protein